MDIKRKPHKAQFANLVIKFGTENLLDRSQIVLGAFLKEPRIRKNGRTNYYFLDVELGQIDPKDPLTTCIFGRFVKNIVLEREQVFREGVLVEDDATLESAPSAFFVVVLASHRVIYLPETRIAPTLDEFGTTISRFVKVEYDNDLELVYKNEKAKNKKFTWKVASQQFPQPTVNLIPLTSRQNIQEFLGRFSKIEKLQVTLIDRNDEFNGKDIVEHFQKRVSVLKPKKATFVASNKSDGLDIPESTEFVSEITESGYEDIGVAGIGQDGAELRGNNEKFSLKFSIDPVGHTFKQKAEQLYGVFSDLVAKKAIRLGFNVTEENKIAEKLKTIIEEAKW